MQQINITTMFGALVVAVSWLLGGCDVQQIEDKHSALQQEMSKLSAKFEERGVLADRLLAVMDKMGCHKEKGFILHLNALRVKVRGEPFDSQMSSRVLVHGYQDLQDNLSGTMHKLLYAANGCARGAARSAEMSALREGVSANDRAIADLYVQINAQIQDYNVLISVPPTSWENKLFCHYLIMHPWQIEAH